MAVRDLLCAFKSTDGGGVQYVNTFAVRCDPGISPTDPSITQIVNAVDAWLSGLYVLLMHPDYTVNELHALGILGYAAEATHSVATPGNLSLSGVGSNTCAKELALVLTLKTSLPGRSGRGRMFIPSPRNASFCANPTSWLQSGAYWTAIANFGNALLGGHDFTYGVGGLEGAHLSTRVWSRVDGVTRDVTSYIRRPEYHFLRSRRSAP